MEWINISVREEFMVVLFIIIFLENLKALEVLEDKIDLEGAKKTLRDVEKHGTVSWEDTKREFGL